MAFVRDMEEKDLPTICEIEDLCFVAPWKKDDILNELRNNPYATLLVVENDNQVVGFADFWVTFDSATICQIAVRPEYQRQHLGSMLMEEILKECSIKKVRHLTLEVRESNVKGINFYQKYGFKTVLNKENYYTNGENALYMVKEVIA